MTPADDYATSYGNALRAFDSGQVTSALEQLEAVKKSLATPVDRLIFITLIIETLSKHQLEIMAADHASQYHARTLDPANAKDAP